MNNLYFGISIAPYRVDLCNWLAEHFQCKIFHRQQQSELAFDPELLAEHCRFEPYTYETRKGVIRQYRFLRRQILENNPSYVFVFEFSLTAVLVLLIRFLTRKHFKVVSICDDSFDMVSGHDFTRAHGIARRIVPPMLDNLILDNRKTEQWFQTHFGKGVYFPIIADEVRWRSRLERVLPDVPSLLAENGIPDGKPVVLFVGRLVDVKNIPALLKAYAALRDDCRLVIIGGGEQKEALQALNRELGCDALFTGPLNGDDLLRWYAAADILVLPSFREPFGAVVNEALMSGLYTLVSDRAGSSTLIEPGVNGLCFNPDSVEDVTAALRTALGAVEPSRRGVLKENLMPCQFEEMIEGAVCQLTGGRAYARDPLKTVLINAYSVSPNRGSEPGMGWNWISHIASFCRVHVITEPEFRADIEEALEHCPYADRMHFYYIPVSERVRRMCRNQGDWRFYFYYRRWQRKALSLAREICQREPVTLIHQLNMVGFREPGYLWKIPGVRYIWGPIGGMTMTPMEFFRNAPLIDRSKMRAKNLLNTVQIHYSFRVRKAIRRADAIICATETEKRILASCFRKDAVVLSETGMVESKYLNGESVSRSGFHLLWAGRFLRSKELELALQIASCLSIPGVKLHIVGTGSPKEIAFYHDIADRLQLGERVIWHGQVSRDDVQRMMALESDLFLFTSVYEATSSVVLEAISNHLPVVCFDTCGFGPIVDSSIGRKVKLTNPEQSVRDFTAVIEELYADPELRKQLSDNCAEKVRQLSWETKMETLMNLYNA